MRVVHYINQFFAGIGGEDAASAPAERRDGAIGPGRRLDALLGDEHTVVATVFCGDDRAASDAAALDEIMELIRSADAEMVLAGPAFSSGRYGVACARVAGAAQAAGLIALASMAADNPGVAEAGAAPIVESGETARHMGPSLHRLDAAHQPPRHAQRRGARRGPRAGAIQWRQDGHRDPPAGLRTCAPGCTH